jgi:hypothetical protein
MTKKLTIKEWLLEEQLKGTLLIKRHSSKWMFWRCLWFNNVL